MFETARASKMFETARYSEKTKVSIFDKRFEPKRP
jgi:hypothetical protein